MEIISTQSLLALIWASATLATPLFGEPISGSDLAIRGAGTARCPSTYESKNGLNFTTYCETNNPGNDATTLSDIGSMEECMERCSRYWGDGEGCFGVVWREDNMCWIRNSSTSDTNLTSDSGIHSALIQYGSLNPLNDDCPFDDGSQQTLTVNGTDLGYTMHCDKSIQDFDECWQGYPECLQTPFIGFYHATSLGDCLNICVKEHPLCQAVVYNPTMNIGYANCWPKSGYGNQLATPGTTMGTLHTATINSFDHTDTKCPSDDTYTATSGSKTTYEVHCGKLNGGSNITSIHQKNVTSCMEACSSSKQGCTGIVFDSTMQGGYSNCYLQNTTGIINAQAQATYAIVAGSTTSDTASTNGTSGSGLGANNNDNKEKSKAWIAGPVLGVLGGLALIGAALLFWRRRKAASASSVREMDGAHTKPPMGVGTAPPSAGMQGPLQHQDTGMSFGAAPAYTPYNQSQQGLVDRDGGQERVKAPNAYTYAQVRQHGPVEMHGETEIFEVPDTGYGNRDGEKGARGGVHEM